MRNSEERNIEDFGKIQIDRMAEMQQWAESIKAVQKDERIRLAIVAANNHMPVSARVLLLYLGTYYGRQRPIDMKEQKNEKRSTSAARHKSTYTF